MGVIDLGDNKHYTDREYETSPIRCFNRARGIPREFITITMN